MQIEFRGGKWEGLEGMSDELMAEIRPALEGKMKAALLYAEGELKNTLTGQRSGRIYKISKTGRTHQASAPGEPPAVLFGNLRNSAGHSDPVWNGDVLEGEWGIGLGTKPANPDEDPEAYATRLEYGGMDSRGVYIAPRPYVAPTEIRIQGPIEAMFATI